MYSSRTQLSVLPYYVILATISISKIMELNIMSSKVLLEV